MSAPSRSTQLSTLSPTPSAQRALAPDLARGGMLLAIAFAHAPLFVLDVHRGPAVLNGIAGVFYMLFVNNHARPMFAFLFCYALVQLTRRGTEWVPMRKLLRRRGWWLIAIGLVHTALLAPLDILSIYGLAALLLVGLLRAKDRTLLWVAGTSLVPATALVAFGMWWAMANGLSFYTAGSVAAGSQGALELFLERLQVWPIGMVSAVVIVVPGIVLGMWGSRRGLLDEPALHRRFLVRATVLATAVSIAGAIPAGLIEAGVWAQPSGAALWAAAIAQPLTGYAGGIAMAGIIALVAIAVERHPGRLTPAVQALGQRSLTFYLFQSVVWVAVFYPYGLGLQDAMGLAGALGVAAATWLLSLVLAEWMRRARYRGPAEILLRRLVYRSRRAAAT